jgi:sulfite exporter TauE/SafE
MGSQSYWRCHLLGPTPDALLLTSWGLALLSAVGGSLHCTVMCGPLRLLIEKGWSYQLGRLFGYLVMGAFFGTLGWQFPWWIWVPLYLLLVSTALCSFSWWKRIQSHVLRVAKVHPLSLGLATAFFPCGLLYAWVGIAALAKHPLYGAVFMGILWLGSLPSLELAPLLLRRMGPWKSRHPKAFTLIFVLLAATPLLLRIRPHVHAGHAAHSTQGPQEPSGNAEKPPHSCH